MKDGFIKVAAVSPKLRVADVTFNGEEIRRLMRESAEKKVKVTVFPELCITGYSCNDLFYQKTLLNAAEKELFLIAKESEDLDGIFFVGLPFVHRDKLYNVAAAVSGGKVLGLVPKKNIPSYNEFYERRQFTEGFDTPENSHINAPIGTMIHFTCAGISNFSIAAEICEDLWVPEPPSVFHACAGADIIVNLSASDELTGKASYRRELVSNQSARLYCGYIYASAGYSESTQDTVCSGHNIIAEGGRILSESRPFKEGMAVTEIDAELLSKRRREMTTFPTYSPANLLEVPFSLKQEETELTRYIDPAPFVPSEDLARKDRCEEILDIQCHGLMKRLCHTGCKKAVVGISGGLDSTLALLVTVRAFDLLSLDRKGIIAVTMPGFGTTDRTYNNAVSMINTLGADFREISIKDSVMLHFKDIDHDINNHDTTYENSQARERTQILMDLSNKENALVVGTGDLSELALGWATYNGDHMSMYGVNGSVPKTLVRHLVRYYADECSGDELKKVLYDVLDTPVSPELLPPEEGKIAQKTEELVGPYELHDFFLYHMFRNGYTPPKIYRIAKKAFKDVYDAATILKWQKTFYRRFFSQQFKRSCLPDGPKVGTVSLSPRGDLRMPSDASSAVWLEELESLEE